MTSHRPSVVIAGGRPSYIEAQGAARWPGEWFPCEAPEKPWDDKTALHDCCHACLISAEANGDPIAPIMRERLDTWGPAPRLNRPSQAPAG